MDAVLGHTGHMRAESFKIHEVVLCRIHPPLHAYTSYTKFPDMNFSRLRSWEPSSVLADPGQPRPVHIHTHKHTHINVLSMQHCCSVYWWQRAAKQIRLLLGAVCGSSPCVLNGKSDLISVRSVISKELHSTYTSNLNYCHLLLICAYYQQRPID